MLAGVAAGSRLQPLDTLDTRLCDTLGGRHLRGSVAMATGCPASGAAHRTTGIKRFLHDAVGCDN